MSDPAASSAPEFLELSDGRRIAYRRTPSRSVAEAGVGAIFLGGFRSDMTGSKAERLEDWARRSGRAFVRFDYTGHGASSGAFDEGSIGAWADDAYEAFTRLTAGPQIVVGSSMGGWIALLLVKRLQEARQAGRVAGLVGIAAAPDFTEDLMWAKMSDANRQALETDGFFDEPSPYDEAPTRITKTLIEDGRERLVLRSPLALRAPMRLLHGSADPDVPLSVGLRLLHHVDCKDARLVVLKGAGHRLSEPAELDLLEKTVEELASSADATA